MSDLHGNITGVGTLQGNITSEATLRGVIAGEETLHGTISANESLQGILSERGGLQGEITIPERVNSNDYEDLVNKPAINNVKLIGDKPLGDFDIQETNTYAKNTDIDDLFR